MRKKIVSTTAFLATWMLVFSMMSTCYCVPASFASAPKAQSGLGVKATGHTCCPGHQKTKACSEHLHPGAAEILAQSSSAPLASKEIVLFAAAMLSGSGMSPDFGLQTTTALVRVQHPNGPPVYLLHHAFLV